MFNRANNNLGPERIRDALEATKKLHRVVISVNAKFPIREIRKPWQDAVKCCLSNPVIQQVRNLSLTLELLVDTRNPSREHLDWERLSEIFEHVPAHAKVGVTLVVCYSGVEKSRSELEDSMNLGISSIGHGPEWSIRLIDRNMVEAEDDEFEDDVSDSEEDENWEL